MLAAICEHRCGNRTPSSVALVRCLRHSAALLLRASIAVGNRARAKLKVQTGRRAQTNAGDVGDVCAATANGTRKCRCRPPPWFFNKAAVDMEDAVRLATRAAHADKSTNSSSQRTADTLLMNRQHRDSSICRRIEVGKRGLSRYTPHKPAQLPTTFQKL